MGETFQGILLSAKDFSFRKLLPKVQGARRFSNGHLPCIPLSKTLLQLPGSKLLSWLFKVCLCHQTELKFQLKAQSEAVKKRNCPMEKDAFKAIVITKILAQPNPTNMLVSIFSTQITFTYSHLVLWI